MEYYKNLSLEDLPNEEWRYIEEYYGLYMVSNLGRVKSLKYNKNRVIKQYITGNGYLTFKAWSLNKSKNLKVHRCVSKAFINNPYDYKEVNHKDENKLNNELSNLEVCNRMYNVNYGERTIKASAKLINRIDCSKKIICIYPNKEIKYFNSVHEASRFFNCKPSHISRVARGERNHYKNIIFKYQ
jgi:hypothetical protein